MKDTLNSIIFVETEKEFEDDHAELLEALDAVDCSDADKEALLETLLALNGVSRDEWEEYQGSKRLNEEGRDAFSEWEDGVTLVAEEAFTEHCEELCEEIGDIPKDFPHYIVIDWDATADNIRADYSEIEISGTTYLGRS